MKAYKESYTATEMKNYRRQLKSLDKWAMELTNADDNKTDSFVLWQDYLDYLLDIYMEDWGNDYVQYRIKKITNKRKIQLN